MQCHLFLLSMDFPQYHLFLLFPNYLQCLDFLECHLSLVFLEGLEEGMMVDAQRIDTTDSV
jgi:hypothetical protein